MTKLHACEVRKAFEYFKVIRYITFRQHLRRAVLAVRAAASPVEMAVRHVWEQMNMCAYDLVYVPEVRPAADEWMTEDDIKPVRFGHESFAVFLFSC